MLLFQHAEMADDIVQLKTLQTILIIFQSRLHPENEVIPSCTLSSFLHAFSVHSFLFFIYLAMMVFTYRASMTFLHTVNCKRGFLNSVQSSRCADNPICLTS